MKITVTYSLILILSFTLVFITFLSCSGRRIMPAQNRKYPNSPLAPFTRVTLDNGLDVVVKEVHSAPIVAVYFWCNTGSVNEEARVHGISHFYEHMFFKGTEKRGVGEIDRAIKSLGGYNNAFTFNEYTTYFVVLPSENFELAADVLVDAIRNSSFEQDEIEKELGVIKEEINRREDNPTSKLYDELFKILFPGTPYAHPVIGTKESISGITRDDFQQYLGKFYVPNNMTAVVVGDVNANDAIEHIRKLTADWKPDDKAQENLTVFTVPEREGISGFTLEKDVNMSYVLIAYRTSGLTNIDENISLDLASSILGEGKSSRLYRRLVEEDQIASSVSAFIYPFKQAGLFAIFGTVDRQNVNRFKEAVLEEVEKLRTNPPDPDELQKVKTMLKADFQFSNETNDDIAHSIGHYITLGYFDQILEYESTIEKTTSADVQQHVSDVLDPSSYTIGIINQRIPTDREVRGE